MSYTIPISIDKLASIDIDYQFHGLVGPGQGVQNTVASYTHIVFTLVKKYFLVLQLSYCFFFFFLIFFHFAKMKEAYLAGLKFSALVEKSF